MGNLATIAVEWKFQKIGRGEVREICTAARNRGIRKLVIRCIDATSGAYEEAELCRVGGVEVKIVPGLDAEYDEDGRARFRPVR